LKTFTTFVLSQTKRLYYSYLGVAIFIATNKGTYAITTGYCLPVDCCTIKSVIVCGRTGGNSLFCIDILIFHPQMSLPQTMKDCSTAKYSNDAATSPHETGTLLKIAGSKQAICISKLFTTFVASSPKTSFNGFSMRGYFFATNAASYAANNGLPIHNSCCALKPVIVFGEMWKGSLSHFNA
jgi:hypothetical protein